MKYKLLIHAFSLVLIAGLGMNLNAQVVQVLDSVDVFYVDNTSDGNSGSTGTLMNDPKYREFPPTNPVPNVDGWWHNAGSVFYGGTSRRASRYGSGNNSGAHAHFYASLQATDHYLIYHHMNSPNATTNAYVTLQRFGEGTIADSLRYNMQFNITPDPIQRGSWHPLSILELFAADSSVTVEIGLDSLGSNTLRTDAIVLVRSRATGADIEMGNRRYTQLIVDPVTGDTTLNNSFYRHRAPVGFPQTTFKWGTYSERQIPVYNIGSQTLTITGFTTQTNRFSVTTPTPINIPPGGKTNITIRFSPRGEETTLDTLYVLCNDAAEPEAPLPLSGTGINYNFILNASVTGQEPHWNVPPPGGQFTTIGTFLGSTPSPFQYPIVGGNIQSVVNTGSDPNIACIYKFNIPDTLSGSYFIEYSGPQGSANAAQNVTVDVVTPFYVNPDPALGDTQRVTGFNSRIPTTVLWARIGGNQIFQLNGGGETTIRMTNPSQGADLLRADLIRVRLVPIAPTISTNLDPARLLNFGSVSIYDSIRQGNLNYRRNFIIGSNGETPLRIDSIYLKHGTTYSIVNLPQLPVTLPAIDGQLNLLVEFLPNEIINYSDSIIIRSNDPTDSLIVVRLAGQGVGTGITVDDTDPTTYIYPAEPIVWTGTPDPTNMDKWYRVQGSGGINANRLFHYIYFNPPTGVPTVEFYPYFPFEAGSTTNTLDSFDVFLNLSPGSSISSPRAKYIINHANPNDPTPDTVFVNQNGVGVVPGGQVPASGRFYVGRYLFLRGGQDSHGSGTIFGSVYLINDTAEVSWYYRDSVENIARRDSHVVRADAVIFEEAGNPLSRIFAEPNLIPDVYSLSQNYPNPFNPTTQIRFTIPEDSRVDLKIYDMLGAEVATIMSDQLKAGYYTVEWDGKNNFGKKVSSGIYIYRMVAGNFVSTKKMLMMK